MYESWRHAIERRSVVIARPHDKRRSVGNSGTPHASAARGGRTKRASPPVLRRIDRAAALGPDFRFDNFSRRDLLKWLAKEKAAGNEDQVACIEEGIKILDKIGWRKLDFSQLKKDS